MVDFTDHWSSDFDVILMDLQMPVLDGESAARYIKSTNSKNTTTPIVAVSAYSSGEPALESQGLFSASIAKPVQKSDLLAIMRQIGFKTSSSTPSGKGLMSTKVLATTAVR
jgi:serine/threonine-protein kinase RIM15